MTDPRIPDRAHRPEVPSPERLAVAFVAAAGLAVPIAQAAAAATRTIAGSAGPAAAGTLSVAAVAVALAAAIGRGLGASRRGAAVATLATAVPCAALLLAGDGGAPALAGLVAACAIAGAGAGPLADRLPSSLDGARRRRPVVAWAWAALGLLAVVQGARLGAYMADPSEDWWITTTHPFFAQHQCFSAYVYAADLHRQGEPNVYDAVHYPGLNPEAAPHPTVGNLDGFVEDPFQYPPQFLLLPLAAISICDDFLVIRTVWYALQVAGFLAVAAMLARWIGGRAGAIALLLLPLLAIAPAVLFNVQYGQVHLPVIALAVAGMLALETRRRPLGAALLAAAISMKLFPALLLVPLAARRRGRDLAWTGALLAAYGLLSFVVLGPAPFEAFLHYHVPRLANGDAFAFGDAWPQFRDMLLVGNLAPSRIAAKLEVIGWGGAAALLAGPLRVGYALAVLGVAFVAGRTGGSRARRAQGWLGLVALASLASPGAWGDYVPVAALWLLSLLGPELARRSRAALALAACGTLLFFLPGVVPTPVLPPMPVASALSIAVSLAMAGLASWAVLRDRRAAPAPDVAGPLSRSASA